MKKVNLSSLARKRNLARQKLYNVMHENEHEFFVCCDKLRHYIYEERRMDIEFKKIYKPYYDKFQKLNREYNKIKIQQKKKGVKS